MENEIGNYCRDVLDIAYYPDELSENNDGHKLYISIEDLIYNKDEIIHLLESL